MARFYFKNDSPIGQQHQPAAVQRELVAADRDRGRRGRLARRWHRSGTDAYPLSAGQQTGAQSTLLVRTAGFDRQLAPQVIETIRAIDPNRPIDHVQTLEEIRDETIAPQRLNATLIGLFSVLALASLPSASPACSRSQSANAPTSWASGSHWAPNASSILRMIPGRRRADGCDRPRVGGAAAIPLSRLMSGLLFEFSRSIRRPSFWPQCC